MARPSPSCAHDDDRLRLPAASPSRRNSAEKKESTDPRLSQLCPPYVTPSSSSSLEYHRSDARIVENGFAAGSGMSNSAKVGLVSWLQGEQFGAFVRHRAWSTNVGITVGPGRSGSYNDINSLMHGAPVGRPLTGLC